MEKHEATMPGIACLCAAVLLGACTGPQPVPATQEEVRQRVIADQVASYAEQEPVSGPISFYEAAARALKYNLDYRLKLLESALAANIRDVSANELLPQLVASAGYSHRSNDSGGTSIGIEDRQVSLRPSTSEERYHTLAGLGLSWNLLDFGVAYYRARQKADQILMAEERRRKVAQNVLQDVRNAYWRALAAQRLKPAVDQLLDRTRRALTSAREAEARGLVPQRDILAYQRALLDSISLLTIRRQDLEFAQSELSALMSLPPGASLVLDDTEEGKLPPLEIADSRLEMVGLQHRPEIMEEWYRKRVNDNDLNIAKAQLWPNVGIDLGIQYDSNQYLYNNHWSQAGVRVSLNLFRLLQIPRLEAQQASQARTDDMRRLALSMAILTQIRVGSLRYRLSLQQMAFAEEGLRVDRSLLDYALAAKTTTFGSELEVIRAEGRFLLSAYQREAAYSDAQAAWGRLFNSVGLDVLPATMAQDDIKTLAREIEKTVKAQEQTQQYLQQPTDEVARSTPATAPADSTRGEGDATTPR